MFNDHFSGKSVFLFATLVLLLALLISGCDGRGAMPTDTPTPASAGLVVLEDSIPQSLLNAPASDGTRVWIEFPFQGQTMPQETITFVVYASSASGVEAINLAVNGEALPVGSPTDLSTDGSRSVVRLEQDWQPPSTGEYMLAAQAGGSAGSSITFCVVNCSGELELVPTDTPTPAPNITDTPTPTPAPNNTDTPTPVPITEPILKFWAEPETIAAGECTTLHWEAEGYETITLHAQTVGFAGTDEKCPCVGTTYPITGTKKDGTTDERTVTIAVNGSCEVPETLPPEEPPQYTDTDGPGLSSLSLVWEGCTFFGQAEITDASGVSQAKFLFNLNNEGEKSLWMQDIGNGFWQSEVGISIGSDGMTTPMGGSIEYRMWAKDTLNNESFSSSTTETYNACTP